MITYTCDQCGGPLGGQLRITATHCRKCPDVDGLDWIRHVTAKIDAELHPVIETVEQLDALPLNTVVVDAAGIPRTSRHGDSHMPGGWTHAGRSPLSSHELADGRPMRVVYTPEADRG